MNAFVLLFASLVALAVGAFIWWLRRNVLVAVSASLALLGLVAVALPWGARPENPGPTPPVQSGGPPSAFQRPSLAMLESDRPIEVAADGYVGSESCRECHPQNHATWHASYHRTMTQVASPDVVLGDFRDVSLSMQGRDYFLHQHGDVCWVAMHDPALPVSEASRVNAPVVMTTGSHHMQAYWYATGTGRVTGLLPIVHLNETQEWIPRSAAFLQPESDGIPGEVARWNMICSECHSTHRRERPRPGTRELWDTQVAEFGIACEACHGPGEKHIQLHRRLDDANETAGNSSSDDPIVNPTNLSHVRSAQVCGQCHSVLSTIQDESVFREHGHSYRPGNDLTETHLIWKRDSDEMREFLSKHPTGMSPEAAMDTVYYRDGVVRVSGREYSGLMDSACHQRGEISCLTCHQMHKSESDTRTLAQWADDQLHPSAFGDSVCLQCHQQEDYSEQHTHHPSGSVGARCYNCHMPHTTYGLLKAIRNHTISSPDMVRDIDAKRPNACNLCHLDQTLEWTAKHLQSWYGADPPELDDDQRNIAASLLWVLKGDAAQRALVAWHMGWDDAKTTSGSDWQAPYLSLLLNDPYPAIRFIARRSLRTMSGFADVEHDNLAPEPMRALAIERIQQQWQQQYQGSHGPRPALLMNDHRVEVGVVRRLLRQRDHTPIELAE